MCFSATASFAVGASLLVPGYIAVKRTKSTKMLAFACTPLVFSMHQIAEGFLWLSLTNQEFASWYKPALYTYSTISQPFWPIWVPLIPWLLEPDKSRKKILFYFLLLGGGLALYLLFCIVVFGMSAAAECGHIRYFRDFPAINSVRAMHFVAIVIPPFLSHVRYMKLLGGVMLGLLILSFIFYRYYVLSVWCFFAAILSVLVLLVIAANKNFMIKTSFQNTEGKFDEILK